MQANQLKPEIVQQRSSLAEQEAIKETEDAKEQLFTKGTVALKTLLRHFACPRWTGLHSSGVSLQKQKKRQVSFEQIWKIPTDNRRLQRSGDCLESVVL